MAGSRFINKVIFINLGVLFAAIFVLELLFGNWIFGPQFGFLNIPRNTNYNFRVDDLYENDGNKINYRRDGLGFRGKYTDLSKIDILTIGGSTTNQLYIDEKETWQSHLKLNFARNGKKITIVDASVDGQSTRGHIAVFDRWLKNIKGLKSQYVVAYIGINDIQVEDAKLGDAMETNDWARKLRHLFLNNSALYNLFRTVRGVLRAHSSKLIHGKELPKIEGWVKVQPFDTIVKPPQKIENRLLSYKLRLNKLIQKIREFGAKPIIVTQHTNGYRIQNNSVYSPKNPHLSFQQWSYPIVRSFNNVSMSVCRSLNAICIDLANDLVFQENDFYDFVHNTPKGTRKIGRYLFEKLNPLFKTTAAPELK